MTPLQQKFILEYCKDISEEGSRPNGTQAAIRAGYSAHTAGQTAYELLKKPEIQEAIQERMADLAAAASVTPELILRLWMDQALADPNELVQVHRVCCRHCYGYGFRYQWTEREYLDALDKAIAAGQPAPDGLGGFGFDPKREPNPECTECGGEGQEEVKLADTRNLSPRARRLYAGAEMTKTGIKVKLRDQDAAADKLARYLGLYKDNLALSGTVAFKPLSDFYGGTPDDAASDSEPGS